MLHELGMIATTDAGASGGRNCGARRCGCWGLALALAALPASARSGSAQLLTTEQGLTFAGAASGGGCATLPTIDTRAELAGPFASIAAAGQAGMHEEKPRPAGTVHASASAPEWHGWRLSGDASFSSSGGLACDPGGRSREAGLEASYRAGQRGLWLGYRWRHAPAALYPPAPGGLNAGAWQSFGDFTVSVSVGTQPDTGSRASYESRQELKDVQFWNDTLQEWETIRQLVTVVDTTIRTWRRSVMESRARVAWAGERWTVGSTLGAMWRPAGQGAELWGVLEGAIVLMPRLALTGTYAAAPNRGLVLYPGRQVATLGFRVLAAPVRPASRAPAGAAGTPRAFETRTRDGDEVTLAVRAPDARYVEITGDFAAWEARRMLPRPNGWWELPVRLPPGRYHVNVRMDGTRWMAPPGLPVARDEFGGTVGVLVLR